MPHKTKAAALKAAHADMGPEAIEGVDFIIKGTNTGWAVEPVAPANVGAAKAQAKRLSVIRTSAPGKVSHLTEAEVKAAGLIEVTDIARNPVWTDPDHPCLVERVIYPNKTRATEARRILEDRAKAEASPAPMAAAKAVAKKSVANKRAARKDAAAPKAKAPKKVAAPKAKKAPKPSAPDGMTKSDMLINMLSTSGGATSKEMEDRAGWLPHSVRGFLGTLRKKHVNVVSKKLPGEPTIYRIVKGKAAAAPAAAEQVGDVI